MPDAAGHFGSFGGRLAPEALMSALDELTIAYAEARADPVFQAELAALLTGYAGRPTLLTEVPRFAAQAGGCRVFLKREDMAHTGSHKINNVLGQALLTKRLGKTRVIAETGAGQHGVATATAAALLGLDCTVYMGEEDTRRQALNVARMQMLGAEVVPVTTGSRTLKDAMNEAFRNWVSTVADTHYCIGSVGGPHPFPMMVRDFQRVIGVEAREQMLQAGGRLPDAVIACVGGGSNAIGIFHAFIPDDRRRADRLRGGRRRPRDRAERGNAELRVGGRAARDAHLPAAGRGRPDARDPLDLRRSRLPGRWSRARLAAADRPGELPAGHRQRGDARFLGRSAAPRASSRPSSLRTRWPARCSSGRNSDPMPCCWSTCPAGATRTSTSPHAGSAISAAGK